MYRKPYPIYVARDSSVGIATRYGLVGSGIESRWWRGRGSGEIFRTRPDQPLGTHPTSYTKGTGSFQGVKRPVSGAEVKESVELHLYSTSGPSRPLLGWPLPFTLYIYIYMYMQKLSFSLSLAVHIYGKFAFDWPVCIYWQKECFVMLVDIKLKLL
jgi:hypothetical protein